VAATKSYSAQLFTSYLLVLTLTDKNIDVLKVISETSRLALEPNLISPTLAKLNRNHEIVFLGRGFAYPNAREAALKIQETNRISVQAYSTADYLHGPISALTSDTQVFFVAPSHAPYESISDAVKKIRETTKNIFWIGNGGKIEPGEVHLDGSNCNDEITSTIADAVVVQRLALEFAVKEGFNPDAPEGLSKVTLTI
jgi:glucosamine--fructose-6-phosphate aminotransferase (isomerizing)